MIGRISGTILSKQPPELLIDVHGIGYEIQAPMTTFYHLPEINESVTLYTHFVVREDAQQLYGFYRLEDRSLFRALLKVNGVGPKLGLSILSSMDSQQFVTSVHDNNTTRLNSIPGIGKKTAERLIIEMRDRLAHLSIHPTQMNLSPSSEDISLNNQSIKDALSALISLGYKNNDAKQVINRIYKINMSSEELIRLSLQQMAKA